MNTFRILFFGTAELACPSLQALVQRPEFEITAVITQPDRPAGRGLRVHPSPVKRVGLQHGLRIDQPARCREPAFIDRARAAAPDLAVVVAYGQILPRLLLDIPRLGFVNVHTSLLPKYRGAAPIQWAILNGDAETGVTIMKIDEGLDTGDILSARSTPILDADNAKTLHDRLAGLGAELLIQTLPSYRDGQLKPIPQPTQGASYARKITREDGRLDWTASARDLWNRIRALVPWPGAFAFLPDEGQPQLLKVWEAEPADHDQGSPGQILTASASGIVVACGQGALRLQRVQREGGRKMSAADYLAGHRLEPGQRFA